MVLSQEQFIDAKSSLKTLIAVVMEYNNDKDGSIVDTQKKFRDVVHAFSVILKYHDFIADLEITKQIEELREDLLQRWDISTG
ncbi:hypothetical protein ES705_17155 [subsurface metagenome]